MSIRTLTYTESLELITETCCNCNITFAMPKTLYDRARADEGKWFYCPNGHSQHYTDSEVTLLKNKLRKREEELAQKQREIESANSARDSFRASAERERSTRKRIEKRVANGVCPCCKRTFKQLARHMGTKHPEYVEEQAK